uniref:Uncharacterized protein n=1 Tax=Plectus sambesii TaxID=2011161 RepID=A0A914VVC1_9BILA
MHCRLTEASELFDERRRGAAYPRREERLSAARRPDARLMGEVAPGARWSANKSTGGAVGRVERRCRYVSRVPVKLRRRQLKSGRAGRTRWVRETGGAQTVHPSVRPSSRQWSSRARSVRPTDERTFTRSGVRCASTGRLRR